MAKLDYYKILELDENATLAMIKKSYRVLAKKYHPDLNPEDEEAAARFVEINEAYGVLSDEKARAKYDAARKAKGAGGAKQKTSDSEDAEEEKPQYKYSESESVKVNFDNWDMQFEDFFGFDPRSKEVDKEKMKKKMDAQKTKTGAAFDAFFGFKPKKK